MTEAQKRASVICYLGFYPQYPSVVFLVCFQRVEFIQPQLAFELFFGGQVGEILGGEDLTVVLRQGVADAGNTGTVLPSFRFSR